MKARRRQGPGAGPPRGGGLAALLLGGAIWLGAAVAGAQPKGAAPAGGEVTGTVLALDGDDLVIDLGTDQGLADGASLELWRPLKLRHPITGKVFVDRFRIGSLEVRQARKTLSISGPVGDLLREARQGDVVVLVGSRLPVTPGPQAAPGPGVERRPGAPPPPLGPAAPGDRAPPAKPSTSPTGPASSARAVPPEGPSEPGEPAASAADEAEVVALAKLLDALRGADISTRVSHYEDFARLHPAGRFHRVLFEEAASLRRLWSEPGRGAQRSSSVRFVPPAEAFAGRPFVLSIEVGDPAAGAVLHLRGRGEPSYRTLPMRPAGAGYLSVAIPAERLSAPGLEYFIEATDPSGAASAVAGSAATPLVLPVERRPVPRAPERLAATLSLWSDYANYNFPHANDRVFQTEGSFGLRLADVGVRAVRTGFGVYRGVGGSLNELDVQGLAGRNVGLTYGYLEGELAVHHNFSFIGRGVVGLLDDGVSGGAQLLVRIMNDLSTNIVLGGEVLGGVGLRGFVEGDLEVFPRVPILLRVEATNQPAGASPSSEAAATPGTVAQNNAEIALRGVAQLGLRVLPELTLSARGSVQGRNIQHAGPGFGGAVGYTW